jgi:3-deoxy-D-manno-octulosonic-acid transferase
MKIGLRIAARKNEKVAATLAGQQGWKKRLQEQLQQRQEDQKTVWFHVASAGEYLQACPVMERLMLRGHQCVLTITSVSGYNWAIKRQLHSNLVAVEYLPLDTRSNVRDLLDIIQPDAVVYVKFDLWPNLIWDTHSRGIPQFLISATLHEKSKRLTSPLARSLYRSLYADLDGIFTVSPLDSERFLSTCPEHHNTHTVGDTRFDSVLDRRNSITPPHMPAFLNEQTTLILGSCWPADQEVIFPAIHQALQKFEELVLIIAPHEIKEAELQSIEDEFGHYGLLRLSQLRPNSNMPFHILLIDSVGQLSALYHYANIAFVGGGFGRGVHNVMEPSAMTVPAIFGPFYQNSPEAIELIENDLAFSVRNTDEFQELLFDLLSRPSYGQQVGKNAADYIENQAGASDACYKLIEDVIA